MPASRSQTLMRDPHFQAKTVRRQSMRSRERYGNAAARDGLDVSLRASSAAASSADLAIPMAPDEMVVHEADCLHQRVADRRADEPEAAAPELLAETVGHVGLRPNVRG